MFRFKSFFYSTQQTKIDQFLKKNFNCVAKNIEIYERALIHGSHNRFSESTFERLEFLGDGVLDLVLRARLYSKFPHHQEGELTKIKSALVSRKSLSAWANLISIDQVLEADYSSMSSKEYLYGNALESLIGALFQDLGYTRAERALHYFFDQVLKIDYELVEDKNYKGIFIEWAQKNKQQWTFDTKSDASNGDFIATVLIDKKISGLGRGRSKKDAEQEAAKNTCSALGII